MNEPLNRNTLGPITDPTEHLFARLFFSYKLDQYFDLYYEKRLIENNSTTEVSLPDFEIIPKQNQNFSFNGCIIETAMSALNTSKKNRQRRAVMGWAQENPDYFYLEFTYVVLKQNPRYVEQIKSIFDGKTTAASLQGKIATAIQESKNI